MNREVDNPQRSADGSERSVSEDDARMLRIQAGDSSAYDELVQIYQGQLYGFFLRNVRDSQLAEDLTQDTLLRLYNQAWDYLPRGRFRGWLYRVARNLMIDSIRRQSSDALVRAVKGHSKDDDDALARLAGEFVPPDQQADQRELGELVDRLLEEIPYDQRMTFTLYHYAGLSLPEVAEVMEAELPTSKSRLRLAREKLREKLRPYGFKGPPDSDSDT